MKIKDLWKQYYECTIKLFFTMLLKNVVKCHQKYLQINYVGNICAMLRIVSGKSANTELEERTFKPEAVKSRVVHNNAFLDNDLGGLGMSYH